MAALRPRLPPKLYYVNFFRCTLFSTAPEENGGAFLSIKPVDDIKSLPTLKVTTKQAKLVELLLLLQLLLHSSKGLLLRRSKRRPTLLGTAASISTPFLLTSMAFEECVILGLGSSRSPRLLLEPGIQQASSSPVAVVVRGDDAVEREK